MLKRLRPLALAVLLLPLTLPAADRLLQADLGKSYVDVDVKATLGSFTARLDNYELRGTVDDKKKIKTAILTFKFADLKTGKLERDAKMLEWLGGADAAGKFEVGILAVTPDGQGEVTGSLTFHGASSLVEFPVNIQLVDGVYTITGEVTIDYRNWGLKVFRTMGVLKVDPEVRIRFKFTGTAVDQPPAAK